MSNICNACIATIFCKYFPFIVLRSDAMGEESDAFCQYAACDWLMTRNRLASAVARLMLDPVQRQMSLLFLKENPHEKVVAKGFYPD
jgi:hypothetical protein